jgi:hypothetical protein
MVLLVCYDVAIRRTGSGDRRGRALRLAATGPLWSPRAGQPGVECFSMNGNGFTGEVRAIARVAGFQRGARGEGDDCGSRKKTPALGHVVPRIGLRDGFRSAGDTGGWRRQRGRQSVSRSMMAGGTPSAPLGSVSAGSGAAMGTRGQAPDLPWAIPCCGLAPILAQFWPAVNSLCRRANEPWLDGPGGTEMQIHCEVRHLPAASGQKEVACGDRPYDRARLRIAANCQ